MIVFYRALNILVNLIEFLILIRILSSFINFSLDNFIGEFIYSMTEPVLSPARKLMNKLNFNTGSFDFSPIVAILFLRVFLSIVQRILFF